MLHHDINGKISLGLAEKSAIADLYENVE